MADWNGPWLPMSPPPHALRPLLPARPVYREPHRIRAAAVLAGLGAGLVWLALFGSLAGDLLSYAWWTVGAAVSAWLVALALARIGDRGVAVGVALAAGFGLSVSMAFVVHRWVTTYDWPMW